MTPNWDDGFPKIPLWNSEVSISRAMLEIPLFEKLIHLDWALGTSTSIMAKLKEIPPRKLQPGKISKATHTIIQRVVGEIHSTLRIWTRHSFRGSRTSSQRKKQNEIRCMSQIKYT